MKTGFLGLQPLPESVVYFPEAAVNMSCFLQFRNANVVSSAQDQWWLFSWNYQLSVGL